jgi:chemotaxis protein methyltransferase CheR
MNPRADPSRSEISPPDPTSADRVGRLVMERTGIRFNDRMRDGLIRKLSDVAERNGIADLEAYHRRLSDFPTESPVWEELIRELTVSETYFFRDTRQFESLWMHILPDLIRRRRNDRCLRIWSAGCSTGEEPYSLAIILREILPDIAGWNISILATDINRSNLARSELGMYRESAFRQTTPFLRKRYFDQRDGLFEIKPEIREMVHFAYLNLAHEDYPSLTTNTNALDLILCRNVAIYLQEDLLKRMAERFHRCLVSDGWFITGAAEAGSALCEPFTYWNDPGTILYRKKAFPPNHPSPMNIVEGLNYCHCLVEEPLPSEAVPLQAAVPELEVVSSTSVGPADLYQEGLRLMREGNCEAAIERLEAVGSDHEVFASACCLKALAHANRGRLKEALPACENAIRVNPLLAEAYYVLALIRQEEGEEAKAQKELKKALFLDPDFILARFSLAVLLKKSGRREKAIRQCSLVFRLIAKASPEDIVRGSEGMTVGRFLTMIRALK